MAQLTPVYQYGTIVCELRDVLRLPKLGFDLECPNNNKVWCLRLKCARTGTDHSLNIADTVPVLRSREIEPILDLGGEIGEMIVI